MAKKASDKKNKNQLWEAKFGADLNFAANEAYNLLRTNLSFSLVDDDKCKMIGVTSPSPSEGKSYTSINLAYSLAEAGHKVILIDGDMRRPSIAKSLNLQAAPGLSDLLVSDDNRVLHEKVLHDNLSVITSGEIPPNPSELLGSGKMKSLLERLSKVFDYILIDLPPVTAVADPLIVSSVVNGLIVVIKHAFTRRSEALEAMRQLQMSRAKILGFVYNNYSKQSSGYFGGYGRYYRNYYRNYYRKGYYTSGNRNTETKNVIYGPEATGKIDF